MNKLLKIKCIKFKNEVEKRKLKLIIMLIILTILLYLIIFKRKVFNSLFLFFNKELLIFYEKLENLYKTKFFLTIILIYLIQIFVIVFAIPFLYFIMCVLIYFILKNNILYYIIIVTSSILSSLIIFLLNKYLFKNYIIKKLEKYEIMKIINLKIKTKPYFHSALLKFLLIPLGIKEYATSVIFKFKYYIFGSFIFYLYKTWQFLFISKEIDSFKNFLYKKHYKKDNLIGDIFSITLLIFSVLISLLIGIWLKININKLN